MTETMTGPGAPAPVDTRDHPPGPVHDLVITWFEANRRDLPWRAAGTTAWGVLVSEVMSQQTPVARVAPSWTRWMRTWPDPAALARAAPAEVLRAWGTLGYPRRALWLKQAAEAIVDRHRGQVPTTTQELRALPGVGEYTAAAVAVFALGQRHPVLDTNVRRVLSRYFTGQAGPRPALSAAERALARRVLPRDGDRARAWSVGVMELGALVCTARNPDCGGCPLRDRCRWVAAGSPPAQVPSRRPQTWHGTDRQVRGRLLGLLRETHRPLPDAELAAAWPDPEQRDRCLASLLADGLATRTDAGYQLPG